MTPDTASNPSPQSHSHPLEEYKKSSAASQSLIRCIQEIVQSLDNNRDSTQRPPEQQDFHLDAHFQELRLHFLQLKHSQRQLGLSVGSDASTRRLHDPRSQVENEALLFQNVLYEKNHLMNSIQSCRQLEVPHLFQMACEELGIDAAELEGDSSAAKDALMDRFLAPPSATTEEGGGKIRPYSHRDVSRHSYNLSKMHSELTIRGTLHKQLLQAKKDKSALLQDLASKKKFLASIPQHVAKIEKGLNGCKEYFQKDTDIMESAVGLRLGMVVSDDNDGGKGGDAVLELSAPLYTLYVQFVSFIQGSFGTLYNCDGWKVKIVESKSWANALNEGLNLNNGHDNEQDDIANSSGGTSHDNHCGMVESGQDQQMEQKEGNDDCNFQKEPRAVQLWIPVGTVDGSEQRKDCIKIQFEFVPKLNVVVAHTVGDKSLSCVWSGGNGGGTSKGARESSLLLLQNLFPDDDGRDLPPGAASRAVHHSELFGESEQKQEEEEEEEEEERNDGDHEHGEDEKETQHPELLSIEQMTIWKMRQLFYTTCQYGRPYRWCQYLAGLHYPNPSSSSSTTESPEELLTQCQIEATTRVVLQTLQRRIRSHSVLWQLMKKLKSLPNPIPVHPSMSLKNTHQNSPGENVSTKLTSFLLMQGKSSVSSATQCDWRVYSVTLKRKSKTLKGQVKISARYPVEPPIWSLQEATGFDTNAKGTKKQKVSPIVGTAIDDNLFLYDSNLGTIESQLNALVDRNDYFNVKDDDSYNWILMHQVRRLILEWDAIQKSLEQTEGA